MKARPKAPNPQPLVSRCTGIYQTRYVPATEPGQPAQEVRELVRHIALRTPRNVRKAPRRGVYIPPSAASQGMRLKPLSKHARQQTRRLDGTRPRKPTREEIAARHRMFAAAHPLPKLR